MNVLEYLAQDVATRKKHLSLEEDCYERGGTSAVHRGVLSQYLGSNIYGRPADLCHACHNPKCSNPKHLYWGTRAENIKDSVENGTHNIGWPSMVQKYGEKEARRLLSEKSKLHHKRLIEQGFKHPHSNTTYINNGVESIRISKTEEIPPGWVKGRLKYSKDSS